MDLFDKEEVTAPSMEAAIAEAVKPAAPTPTPAPVKSGAECTRDTRGEADCAVKNCENCN
jgi:hypothetical protein